MVIIGHKLVDFKPFFRIMESCDIENTPPNSTVLIKYSSKSIETLRYCQENGVSFAVFINSISELMITNSYQPNFFVVEKEIVKETQKIADEYLFDAKILYHSKDYNDLEFTACNFIDGIIFDEGIV